MTKQSGYATKQTGYFWTKQLGLNNYITELENNKFSQIENVDEEIEGEGYISTGTLYSNGTTSVSMSLADGTLGMYIVIVEEGEE